MHFTTAAISALALPAFAAAQYGYAPPNGGNSGGSPSTSSAASAPTAPPSGNGFINVRDHSFLNWKSSLSFRSLGRRRTWRQFRIQPEQFHSTERDDCHFLLPKVCVLVVFLCIGVN